jgi:predicted phage terminase large subunit-like protein
MNDANRRTSNVSNRLLRAVGSRRAVAPYLAEDFSAFCQRAWRVVDGSKLGWNWHHELLCEYLTLARQRKIKRLAIAVPPRSGKSLIVSVFFPAWCWVSSPQDCFLCASHSERLSTSLSSTRRTLLQSTWYNRLWPGMVQFRSDANRVDDYSNVAHGRIVSTGLDNVVGLGADYVIVDDPLTPDDAFSEVKRASAIRAFNGGLRSRLNDPENGVIIVIQQRLHRGDLIGTLQDSPHAGDWTFLTLPMIAPEEQTIHFPISGKVVRRAKGDLLHPARWSQTWCEREAEADPYIWNAQYMQSPSDPSQSILKADWFKYWVPLGTLEKPEGALLLPESFDDVVITGDLAFTATQNSDRVCIGAWGHKNNFKYLLDLAWARMDFTESVQAIRELVQRFPNYNKIYIEKAANGAALISALENEVPGIVGVPASGSKVARYHAISSQLSRGEVVLPHPMLSARTREFVSECAHAGIGGRFDDAADMMALALSQMAASSCSPPPFMIDRANRFQHLRDYINGSESRGVDPAFGKAITDGRGLLDLTEQQLDSFIFGDHLSQQAKPTKTLDNDSLSFNRFVAELFDDNDGDNEDK